MSDFLSRLAARLTASDPPVRPRPRARFESSDPQTDSIEARTETVEARDAERPSEAGSESTAGPRTGTGVEPSSTPVSRDEQGSSAVDRARQRAPHAEPASRQAPAPSSQQPHEAQKASSLHESGRVREAPAAQPSADRSDPPWARPDAVSAPDTEPAEATTKPAVTLERVIEVLTRPAAAEPAQTTPPAPVAPIDAVRDAEVSEVPETVYEISIGRIELQAPPAATKPVARRPEPELRLEDYLARRRGSRR